MKFEQKIIMLKFKLCDFETIYHRMHLFETGFVFDLNIKKMMGWHDGTKPCSKSELLHGLWVWLGAFVIYFIN